VIVYICVYVQLQIYDISIGVKFCTMVDTGPGHKVSIWGPKIQNVYREYLENDKSQRYMSIRA